MALAARQVKITVRTAPQISFWPFPFLFFFNKQENRGKQSKSQKSTQEFLQDWKKFLIQFDVKVHETYQNISTLLIALV